MAVVIHLQGKNVTIIVKTDTITYDEFVNFSTQIRPPEGSNWCGAIRRPFVPPWPTPPHEWVRISDLNAIGCVVCGRKLGLDLNRMEGHSAIIRCRQAIRDLERLWSPPALYE